MGLGGGEENHESKHNPVNRQVSFKPSINLPSCSFNG